MMRCVDLFSGCGGFSLGFKQAGFEILASIDNWDKAVEVYQQNFSHDCFLENLSDETKALNILEKYMPDLVMGGPPCQDFSSAGKRDETLGRADLTCHFANIICTYKPKWFVMENVERIKKSQILTDVSNQFLESGYGLTAAILDASYCQTPQARNRFFMIGHLGGKNNSLNLIYANKLAKKPMTIRDYLGQSLGLEYYYRHPRNYNRRGIFSIDEPSPTVRGVNRPVPKGYKKHQGDPENIALSEVRPLTTIERSYLQTFPKNFKFSGTKTNLEQMIGNAVPINLATFIAKGILEFINHSTSTQHAVGIQTELFENNNFNIPDKVLHRMSV